MNNKALYRTSAVVYAEENLSSRKTETIRRKFVEAVMVEKNNAKMTVPEIGVAVNEVLEIFFTDKEIESIVGNSEYFVEELGGTHDQNKYNLKNERYNRLQAKARDNIEVVINRYLESLSQDMENANTSSVESIRELLNKYLFTLMNTNILAYRQVLEPSSVQRDNSNEDKTNGRVDFSDFSEREKECINSFLSWSDSEKDRALYKLVSCCIEYAIAINNSKENALVESFKNKVFYLDNALLYRAIGINGETRKKRTLSFIRKCRESGQNLCVSKYSYQEFLRTIDIHLKQLNRTTPFGKINPSIFQYYANGEGFFQFYHSWRGNRTTYSFDIFKNYIIGEYNSLLKMYDINEDYRVPYSEDENIPVIDKYAEEIKAYKRGRGHQNLHDADARNMYWIECKRNGNDGRMTNTKYYFVTSDQKLQLWDYHHSHNQPLTLLPSQWMALLLKYYSRTNDDYKSFVSFLNIPIDEPGLKPEELQDILAGISQTTEDFTKQTSIVETFLETDWQTQQQGSPRTIAREYAKEKLEDEFAQKILAKEIEYGQRISEWQEEKQIQIDSIKEAFRQQSEQIERQSMQDKLDMITQQLIDVNLLKQSVDMKVEREMKMLRLRLYVVAIILFIVWVFCIVFFAVKSMVFLSASIGILGVLVSILYCVIYEKSFLLKNTMARIRLKTELKYSPQYLYSDSRMKELKSMENQLKVELSSKY